MSTNFHSQEPLPEEAAAALQNSGARLLAQLGVMRAGAGADPDLGAELEPLDPQAELSLRRSGDAFLEQLDAQREEVVAADAEPEKTSTTRWIWRRGAGIAAVLAGLLAAAQFNATPPEESIKTKPKLSVNQPEGEAPPNMVVPEPSSALLGIVGGIFLLYRRRR